MPLDDIRLDVDKLFDSLPVSFSFSLIFVDFKTFQMTCLISVIFSYTPVFSMPFLHA